jgi:hypothetical protein
LGISRWLVYFLAVFLSLTLIAIAMVELLYFLQVGPPLNAALTVQSQHLQPYLEDITYLSQFEILKRRSSAYAGAYATGDSSTKSDAGPFLNSNLHWEPVFNRKRGIPRPLVSGSIRESILRLSNDWMRKHDRAKRMQADLSFFDKIGEFDYWDIEQMSPIEDLILENLFVPPPQLPIPEISDLLAAIKLHLMRNALDGGNPLRALKEVRSFGRLLMTTENIQLVLAGLSALDDERQAYRFYVDEKGLDPRAWVPIDRNITRRAYREILATRGYLHLWTNPETLKKIFLSKSEPIGFCAAVNEAMPEDFSLRPMLKPRLPLERNFQDQYVLVDKVLQRATETCRLRYLSQLVKKNHFASELPGPLVLNRMPYARKIFGLRTAVVDFGGFDAYSALLAYGGAKGN